MKKMGNKSYKFLGGLLAFTILSFNLAAQDVITFKWTAGTSEKSFYLCATYGKNLTIDWGEGSPETETGDINLLTLSHTYGTAGTYDVTITASTVDCRFTYLLMDGCEVVSLNVSGAPALTHIECCNNNSPNSLSSLNLSNNTALESLLLHNNGLSSLPNISVNTSLKVLWCNNNQISSLNLSANTALTDLRCQNNLLNNLNVSTNTALVRLWCSNNNLTDLNVNANIALEYLYCYDNELDSLKLDFNTALKQLYCYRNHLQLSDLYAGHLKISAPVNKHLGTQTLAARTVNTGVPVTFTPAQNLFNSIYTAFSIEQGGSPVTAGPTTYTVTNGVLTFHAAGNYIVTMTNAAIISDAGFPAKVIIPFTVMGVGSLVYAQVITCWETDTINLAKRLGISPCNSPSLSITSGATTKLGAAVSDNGSNVVYKYATISNKPVVGADTVEFTLICGGITQSGTLFITVIACPDNIITADCFDDPPKIEFDIRELTRSATEVNITTNPIAGDIDGDGEVEILVMNHSGGTPTNASNSTAIHVYGFTKTTNSLYLKYQIPLPVNSTINPHSPLAIAKVDGNPYASIFYASSIDMKLYKYDLTGGIPVTFPSTTSWTQSWATIYTPHSIYATVSPVIADIMGSGRTQAVMLDKVIDTKTGNIIANGNLMPPTNVRDDNRSFGWFGHPVSGGGGNGFESCPVVIDIDEDGIQEVIGGDCVYGIHLVDFDNANPSNTFTLKMRADKTGHAEIGDGGTAVADIDNCGQLEVIVACPSANAFASSANAALYIYNPRTGEVIHDNVIANIPRYWNIFGPSRPFVGDFDNDGIAEIAVTGDKTLRSYKYDKTNRLLSMEWNLPTTDASGSTTLTIFNFAQDGKNRLVYRDETQLRVIDASTTPPIVDALFDHVESPTINEFPIIADINGDGAAEIIVTGAIIGKPDGTNWTMRGELRVYASDGRPWAPARGVWNQSAYYSLNVNEDLTIPKQPISPATVFPGADGIFGTSDDVRPFNGFLMQQSILNVNGGAFWPTPNIVWFNNIEPTMVVEGDSAVVTGCIENIGDAPLVTPFYVTFYKNKTELGNILEVLETMLQAAPNENTCFRFVLNNLSSYGAMDSLWISLNDRGTGVYPYQPQCFVDGRRKLTCPLIGIPEQPIISGSATVCPTTTGHIYSVADVVNVTYTWEVPAGWTITSGQGTYQITVTAGSAGGNIVVTPKSVCGEGLAQTKSVSLYPAITATINYSTVCDAYPATTGTVTVTTNPAGSYDYSWNGAPYQTGVGANVFSGIETGNGYTITIKDANGCTKTQPGVTVSCKTFKTKSSQYIACPGATVTLEMLSVIDVSYYWFDAETNGNNLAGPTDSYQVSKDATALQTYWVEPRTSSEIFDRVRIDLSLSQSCGGAVADCILNGTLIFKEDFGGNSPSDPQIKPSGIPQVVGYTYTLGTPNVNLGASMYTIAKSTAVLTNSAWDKNIDDHTFPNDPTQGYLVAFNAADEPGQFYECQIDNLCSGTNLYFSVWVNNMLLTNLPDAPNHIYSLEDLNGNMLVSYYTGNMPQPLVGWKNWGFEFAVPDGISSVILRVLNNGTGSSGNDFVIDDIEIYVCFPEVEIALESDCGGNSVKLTASFTDDNNITKNGTLPLNGYWIKSSTNDINNLSLWEKVTGTEVATSVGEMTIHSLENIPVTNDTVYYRFVVGSSMTVDNPMCRATSEVLEVYKRYAPAMQLRDTAVCGTQTIDLYTRVTHLQHALATNLKFSTANGVNFNIGLISNPTTYTVTTNHPVYVMVENEYECTNDTTAGANAINITVNPLPAVTITTSVVCDTYPATTGKITVTAPSSGYNYQLDSNTPQTGTNANIFNGVGSGSHTITIIDGNGCKKTESGVTVDCPDSNPTVRGTVFPFVNRGEGDASAAGFNSQFPITVKLKAVPTFGSKPTEAQLTAFFNGAHLHSTTVVPYTGAKFVPNTPEHPGALGEFTNYGELINFGPIGKTHVPGSPRILLNNEAPFTIEGATVGFYEFTNVAPGAYILEISRAGYMVRWAKITVNNTDAVQNLKHREIIPGYVITDDAPTYLKIFTNDAAELARLIEQGIYYKGSGYDPKYDLNADGYIDAYDYYLLKKYINFMHEHYEDTWSWIDGY